MPESCHKGLNSRYIRVGAKESLKKTGLYCFTCDIYYSPNLEKQYTVMQKQYTVQRSPNHPSSHQTELRRKPWAGIEPATFALPRRTLWPG